MQQNADPEEWPEDQNHLRALDNSLRCSICHDFFSAPVVLPCLHTFCSSCIRNNFDYKVSQNNPTNCPQCRKPCNTPQLQPNVCLREAVTAYLTARPILVDAVRRSRQIQSGPHASASAAVCTAACSVAPPLPAPAPGTAPPVPVLEDAGIQEEEADAVSTSESSKHDPDPSVVSIPSSSDDSHGGAPEINTRAAKRRKTDLRPQAPAQWASRAAGDGPPAAADVAGPSSDRPGYVSCPVCQLSIKHEFINPHLDGCLSKLERGVPQTAPRQHQQPSSRHNEQPTAEQAESEEVKAPPSVAWNLIKNDKDARAKLQAVGLPSHGSRQDLERRYSAFRRFVSVAKDSGRRVGLQQLLAEFAVEERRTAANRAAALPPTPPTGNGAPLLVGPNDFATLTREVRMRQPQRQGSATSVPGAANDSGGEEQGSGGNHQPPNAHATAVAPPGGAMGLEEGTAGSAPVPGAAPAPPGQLGAGGPSGSMLVGPLPGVGGPSGSMQAGPLPGVGGQAGMYEGGQAGMADARGEEEWGEEWEPSPSQVGLVARCQAAALQATRSVSGEELLQTSQ